MESPPDVIGLIPQLLSTSLVCISKVALNVLAVSYGLRIKAFCRGHLASGQLKQRVNGQHDSVLFRPLYINTE